MAFPQAWLDELLQRNEIVSVISSYVDLKPKGRRLWACCPLHGEKTASFSVSPDKQVFYCFGCHAGGTVVQFVMAMERLTFGEAVRYLAATASCRRRGGRGLGSMTPHGRQRGIILNALPIRSSARRGVNMRQSAD